MEKLKITVGKTDFHFKSFDELKIDLSKALEEINKQYTSLKENFAKVKKQKSELEKALKVIEKQTATQGMVNQ